MIDFMTEAAGCKPLTFPFKPVSVSVLCAHSYLLRAGDNAELIRNTEAPFRAALFVLCGAGLVIYAVISWIKAGKEKQEAESDNPDSLK